MDFLPVLSDSAQAFWRTSYGLLLFYARALYARDDARTPTIVNLAAGVAGGGLDV